MSESAPRLARRLGLVRTTAIALGAMIGAGVYVSLGEAARATGASLIVALLVGAAVATLNGLSSAELGANHPRAGGAYEFGRLMLSPVVGYLAGWLFILASLSAGATFALAFSDYLRPLLPGVPAKVAGLALVLVATALNASGVRLSSLVNVALAAINVAILLVFVLLAAPHASAQHFQPFLSHGAIGVLQAGALMFFAYTGYARPVTVVEEIKEPRRTLPRAIGIAIAAAAVLYLAVALAALGAIGPARLGEGQAPLREVMSLTAGSRGATLVSIGALVASTTVMLTEIWGLSRLLFAMARNGDLPAWLAVLTPGGSVPRRAVLVCGACLLALSAGLDLRPALEASSLALLAYYAIMNLSATRLAPAQRLYPAAVPVAGFCACVLVALSLPWPTLLAVAAVAVVGLGWYGVRTRQAAG